MVLVNFDISNWYIVPGTRAALQFKRVPGTCFGSFLRTHTGTGTCFELFPSSKTGTGAYFEKFLHSPTGTWYQ